jgi:hypothetical protein
MELIINPDGVSAEDAVQSGKPGADYNDLTGSWSTSASSGSTKYMFEFKANKTVVYTS